MSIISLFEKKNCVIQKKCYIHLTLNSEWRVVIIVLFTSRTQIISYHVHYYNGKILCRDKYIYFSLIIII